MLFSGETTGGNAIGAKCVFPFKYQRTIYSECTLNDHHEYWCATTTDFDVDKKWGECICKYYISYSSLINSH